MLSGCSECAYNIDDYCIMFDDVLGFEDCIFKNQVENEGE